MTTIKLVAQRAIMFLSTAAVLGIIVETGKRW